MASSSKNIIGPCIPSAIQPNKSSDSSTDSESDNSEEEIKQSSIGPNLPPELRKRLCSSDEEDSSNAVKKLKADHSQIGPSLPPGFQRANIEESDSDDDLIGPKIPGADLYANENEAAAAFERRSEMMRNKLLGKDEVKQTRETWMTELPDKLGSSIGMPVAKTRFGDGKKKMDRTGWTETPQEKEQRLLEGNAPKSSGPEEEFQYVPDERDREMLAAVEDFKSQRPESLLEMHRKKLNKKNKKKEKKEKKDKKEKKKKSKKDKKEKRSKKDKKDSKKSNEIRRPFDRDLDLKANVFDNAKRNALIKRSGQLNSRFASSGVQGQFL